MQARWPLVLLFVSGACATGRQQARVAPSQTAPVVDAATAPNLEPLEDPALQQADRIYAARLVQAPKDTRAYMARAMVRQRAGDHHGAELLYEACRRVDPDFGPAWANHGALLLEMDQNQRAVALLMQGAARAPDHAPLFANLAGGLARLERYDEAIAAAETAVALSPKDSDLRRNMAAIYFRAERFEEAERTLKQALAEFPEDAPDFLMRLSELNLARGNEEMSLEFLSRVNSLAPELAVPWLRRAALLGRQDDLQGCIRVLLEALDHHPDNEDVRGFFMAAMTLKLQRDLEEGLDRIGHDASDVEAYLQVARVHEITHEYQDAVDVLEDGVQHNPLASQLWNQLGMLQARLEHEKEALDAYRTAIGLDRSAPTLNNCAYLLVTATDPALRNLDEALRLATEATVMDPENAAFLDTLAEVNFARGNLARAQELIGRALALKPDDPWLLTQVQRFSGNPDLGARTRPRPPGGGGP